MCICMAFRCCRCRCLPKWSSCALDWTTVLPSLSRKQFFPWKRGDYCWCVDTGRMSLTSIAFKFTLSLLSRSYWKIRQTEPYVFMVICMHIHVDASILGQSYVCYVNLYVVVYSRIPIPNSDGLDSAEYRNKIQYPKQILRRQMPRRDREIAFGEFFRIEVLQNWRFVDFIIAM